MLQNASDDNSTLIKKMAWYRQATMSKQIDLSGFHSQRVNNSESVSMS